ncbi:MAG: hypothetical protein A3K03_10045, partial [Bdellovibrionales bacterium RIFOXYD1_FULL_44_7]
KTAENRIEHLSERCFLLLSYVFGQKAVLRKFSAGIMHVTIFWGFLVLSFGTLEQFISTIYRSANFVFIGPFLYRFFVFSQDFFAIAVLLAVFYALYRRHIIRPEGLGTSRDADIILGLIGLLMISIIFMNTFRVLAFFPWYAKAMPVSSLLSTRFANLDTSTSYLLFYIFKWLHNLLILGFAVYLPGSKHLHIVTAAPNTFLKRLTREKAPATVDFEDPTIDQYGAAKITDLNWKDALDNFSCTECGRCQDLCPAHNTQKPLSPKMLILDLKENLKRNRIEILKGNKTAVGPILDDEITENVIWSCTFCRSCESTCPVFIDHTDKVLEVRRDLVMMKSSFPDELQTLFRNLETYGSPWPFNQDDRLKWAEGLQVTKASEGGKTNLLLWVGCAGAFDERQKTVTRSLVSIFKKAGIQFSVLGDEETCTGDAARRLGNEYLFQQLAKKNVETLNKYDVKKIVTACPHCFNTLRNDYREFGGKYEVQHHTEFLADLISTGKIKPTK